MPARKYESISILNPELPEDKFTFEIIQEHDAEKYLWLLWIINLCIIFFLVALT